MEVLLRIIALLYTLWHVSVIHWVFFFRFFPSSHTECVVACHKFVEVNALGLTVAALSSYDSNVRAAAYFVLAAFRSHLEGARFREKSQVRLSSVIVCQVRHFRSQTLTGELLLYSCIYMHMVRELKEAFYPLFHCFSIALCFLLLQPVGRKRGGNVF